MYIHELLNNPEFNFNAPVRILKYLGGDETVTVFDSTVSGDIHLVFSRSSTQTELWNLPPEVHIDLTSGGGRVMNPTSRTALKSRRRLFHEDHRSYHRR